MNQTDGFREMEIYKMACTRLRPDQHAVNKIGRASCRERV